MGNLSPIGGLQDRLLGTTQESRVSPTLLHRRVSICVWESKVICRTVPEPQNQLYLQDLDASKCSNLY